MRDMMGLMKQAQAMQSKMTALQEEMETVLVEGAEIAGAEPALGVEAAVPGPCAAVVAAHQVRRLQQDLTVHAQPHLHAQRHDAVDPARPGRLRLPSHRRSCRCGTQAWSERRKAIWPAGKPPRWLRR